MASNSSIQKVLSSPNSCCLAYGYTGFNNYVASSQLSSENPPSSTSTTSLNYTPITLEPDSAIVSKSNVNPVKIRKVYPCSKCPKHFSRPSALETHSYSHTLEKPFQCLSPNCGRKFSVVSNLRRHFKVHQKSSVGCTRISSQDRLHCVRRLIKSNSKGNESSTYKDQSSGNDYYDNFVTNSPVSSNETRSQHYLLLPLIVNTDTITHSINNDGVKVGHQNMTKKLDESALYYTLPYSWSEQTNTVNQYIGEQTSIPEFEIQQPSVNSDTALSVLTTFVDFSFLHQP